MGSEYATDNRPNVTRSIEKISIAVAAFNEDFILLQPYVYDKKSTAISLSPENKVFSKKNSIKTSILSCLLVAFPEEELETQEKNDR